MGKRKNSLHSILIPLMVSFLKIIQEVIAAAARAIENNSTKANANCHGGMAKRTGGRV